MGPQTIVYEVYEADAKNIPLRKPLATLADPDQSYRTAKRLAANYRGISFVVRKVVRTQVATFNVKADPALI